MCGPQVTDRVWFELAVNGTTMTDRIEFGLFGARCPKTVANFVALCRGDTPSTTRPGQLLSLRGSAFHRIIPGFMLQGGDITAGDGTGGESIYGAKVSLKFLQLNDYNKSGLKKSTVFNFKRIVHFSAHCMESLRLLHCHPFSHSLYMLFCSAILPNSLTTRIFLWATLQKAFCPWPTAVPTPAGPSFSSRPRPLPGSTASTRSLAGSCRAIRKSWCLRKAAGLEAVM